MHTYYVSATDLGVWGGEVNNQIKFEIWIYYFSEDKLHITINLYFGIYKFYVNF